MKRLAFMLAVVGGLVVASVAVASVAPQRIETRPYGYINTPEEATTAAMGGPGVVLTDNVKSRVVIQYTGGAPCGPMRPSDDDTTADPTSSERAGNAPSDESGIWQLVGIGVGAAAVVGLVGFLFLRRS